MIRFKIVSGKMAGTERVARHFPFRIGRSPTTDLQLDDAGVWDQHLELKFDSTAGFVLTTHPQALTTVNGLPVREAILRNGDAIEIGALKMLFWLGDTRQISLRFRECATWVAFVLVVVVQLGLIYWLMR
jgi:pSer/pThr/pTyr-binding forkhead associated (FHA) protein